jgi:hypothetical protein
MTPHISGTSIDAQERYAKGTHDIIQRYLADKDQEPANLIVINGDVSDRSCGDSRGEVSADAQYASKAYGQRDQKASGQKPAGP